MATPAGKYKAVRTEVDGISFASRKEARRYSELKLLERSGQIKGLQLQPRYPLSVNGEKVCTYVADFTYETQLAGGASDKRTWVVEDVKGFKTSLYRLKAKLFHALYGVSVTEI